MLDRRSLVRDPRLEWLLCAAHAALAIALFHSVRFDDAFIIYRYGQNLADGHGLTFNIGETAWGSTSVTWVFLSAAVYSVVGHEATPSVMASLGCIAWSAQSMLVYSTLREARKPTAGALAALAIGLGAAGSFCWVGMETHLAFALALGGILAALRNRWTLSAILAAFAILTRPDTIVPALLIAGMAWNRLRFGAVRHALWGAAVLLPWYGYQYWHFRSAVSSSMSNKIGLSSVSHYLLHVATIMPAELLSMVTGWSAPRIAIFAVPVVWPLVIYGAVALVLTDKRLVVVPAWALAHIAGYLVWRPLTNQTWHMYPLVALSVVLAWTALQGLYERLRNLVLLRRVALPLAGAMLLGVALLRTAWFAGTGAETIFWFGGRHRAYVDAAQLIRSQSRPDDLVAAGEVGTLAYYSGASVQDWNGLVTPDHHRLVRSLAEGKPGRVRWVAAWAREDLAYFQASVKDRDGLVWHVPGSERSIYLIDLASKTSAK